MKATQDLIEEELLRLCRQGNFEAFMLFNREGILMASAGHPVHYNSDALTALSVLFAQSDELLNDFQADASVDEIALRTVDNARIVSRSFQVEEAELILIAIVPPQISYRQITNTAVHQIQTIMTETA